jgi:hypothetical protein
MVNIKNLYGGTLGTGSATLYTATNKAIVKEIILCNKTASAATATITFDGKSVIGAKSIAANDTLIIPLNSVIESGKIIAGLSGTASAIDCYISAVEVA